MTLRLSKSQVDGLGYDFSATVEQYRQAKLAHRFAPLNDLGIGPPAPLTYPLVQAAVRRVPPTLPDQPDDFVSDFVIEDDTPPPPTFVQHKAARMEEVARLEQAALDAVIPPGKRRLFGMERLRLSAIDPLELTTAEAQQLADYKQLFDKWAAVAFHAATLCSQIEDQTEATLDAWEPAPFPAG